MTKKRVIFDKPDFKRIQEEGLLGVDMHFHTKYSDTYTRIPNVLKKARKNGIGVAITDHNRIKGAAVAINLKKDVVIIPGIEVNCFEGAHVLLYFYHINDLTEFYIKHIKNYVERNPYMATNIRTEQIADAAKDYNCIVSAAHPFTPATGGMEWAIKKGFLDKNIYDKMQAVEVINGGHTEKMNLKATHLALEMEKQVTGGSDGHTLAALGGVLSIADAHNTESFLEAVRRRRNVVVGKSLAVMPRLASYSKNISKHLQYLVPSVKLKIKRAKELGIEKRYKPLLSEKVDAVKSVAKKVAEKVNGNKKQKQ
ncbi:PHP domain-containing protein [Candidatus Woesearchaeota archaeon]|nr:MAG: PHP domain-containing protein [Candidatus Woesearchaeota archaeon]